ncbi:hypothetical protein S245_055689, partial [Arachis hypogaea]
FRSAEGYTIYGRVKIPSRPGDKAICGNKTRTNSSLRMQTWLLRELLAIQMSSSRTAQAQAMKEQAQLREKMAYQYKLGNFEAAAAIQRRLKFKGRQRMAVMLVCINVFLLNSNSFTGRIPHSIGNLSNLYWLDLADNELQGPIPISSGSVPGLDKLHHAKHLKTMLLRSSSTPIPTSFIPHSREPSSPEAERVLQFSRTRSFANPRQNLPDSSDHRSPTKHDNKSCIPRSNVLKSQHGTKIKESDQVIHTTKGKPLIRELFSVSGLDRQILVEYDEDGGEETKRDGGGWESDKTHAYYQTMIQANPNNALLLGNYTKFLKEVKLVFETYQYMEDLRKLLCSVYEWFTDIQFANI